MKLIRNYLIPCLFCAGMLLAGGCSKEKTSRYDLLVNKEWRIKDLQIKNDPLPGFSILDSCNSDNSIRLYPEGQMEFNYGQIKCHSNEQQILREEWSLDETGAALIMASVRYNIEILDDKYLRLLLPDYRIPGTNDTASLYFMFECR